MTIETRLPYLAALLIEKSISEQEVQEMLALPLTQFLPFTDEKQVNAIIQAMHCKYGRTSYRPESFSVSKVRSDIFEIQYERHTRSDEWSVATRQYPILNRGRESESELISAHVAISEESALQIEAVGAPTPAGKSSLYKISGIHRDVNSLEDFVTEIFLPMQTQAPLLRTPNGITIETLLAIAAHQLEGLQAGPYPCKENDMASSVHARSLRTSNA